MLRCSTALCATLAEALFGARVRARLTNPQALLPPAARRPRPQRLLETPVAQCITATRKRSRHVKRTSRRAGAQLWRSFVFGA
jgi:hypothetical protein